MTYKFQSLRPMRTSAFERFSVDLLPRPECLHQRSCRAYACVKLESFFARHGSPSAILRAQSGTKINLRSPASFTATSVCHLRRSAAR